MKHLLLAALTMFTLQAQADTKLDQGWMCGLKYEAQAQGFQVIAGSFAIVGKGEINCTNLNGSKEVIPVNVAIKTRPVAAKIAFGKYKVYGASANVYLLNHVPKDLLGNYYVAEAQGSIIGGVGVITGTHKTNRALSLYLSVNALKGFGMNLGASKMLIELDETRL
ncbi:MAG: hypothetical protein ABL958_19930 [Bdellovibrionia bacterium]